MKTLSMKIATVLILLIGLTVGIESSAQTVLDGAYIKEHTQTKRVVPYPHIREADVMWSRRVWRVIDLREKINHPLYYPEEPLNDRLSLFDVIKQSILDDGSITAYNPGPLLDDDEFTVAYMPSEVKSLLSTVDTVMVEDLETGDFVPEYVPIDIESRDIKMYRVKEDWIFDKQRSKIDIRIIGIAPMREMRGESGELRGYAPLFWLYYPECRYVFANHEVFNRSNDAERRSFEDIFWKRQFSSYIYKWSNVYDRNIGDYKSGIDALLEGEEIKAKLFNFEHDLWHF